MTSFWVLMQRRADGKVYADLHKVRNHSFFLTPKDADDELGSLPAEERGWWRVVEMVGTLASPGGAALGSETMTSMDSEEDA